MKYVLFVEGDESFLERLKSELIHLSLKFSPLTASNGKEAVQVLESGMVDLVVTGLEMQFMDGFELLSYMTIHFPSIPAIILTTFSSDKSRKRAESLSVLKVLEKPIDNQEMIQVITAYLDQEDKKEFLSGITVHSFLELIEIEQKTSLLEIKNEDKNEKGFFFFNKGELFDAVIDGKTGEQAAIEMIAWKRAEIRLRNAPTENIRRRIHKDLMSIFPESMHFENQMALKNIGETIEFERIETESSFHQQEAELNIKGPVLVSESTLPDTPTEIVEPHPEDLEMEHRIKTPEVPQPLEKTSTQVLSEISNIQGIEAAVIVTRDGFVVESDGILTRINLDMIAAFVAMAVNGIKKSDQESNEAVFMGLTLEFSDALIKCVPVGNILLVILVSEVSDSKRLNEIQLGLKKSISELGNLV